MVEQGKKRAVASAYEWPGWGRSARGAAAEANAVAILEAYRPRVARVAERAGLGAEFAATGEIEVVERLAGTGMTDYYGVSQRHAEAEYAAMTEAECERRIALLRAAWTTFDEAAARASGELRQGPRGGGRDRDRIVRHVNGTELDEYGKKVGVRTPLEARDDPVALRAHREAFCDGIREYNTRGPNAGVWTLQFLIRRDAWHFLDHAWELEDRDLSAKP
jgi:hypothetical protein